VTAWFGKRIRYRRWLAEGVEGWEASIVHVKDVHHLLLRLTPPLGGREDSSIGCEVRLPDGSEAEASEHIPWPLPGTTESKVRLPGSTKTNGKVNDYFFVMFPDSALRRNGSP